MIPTERKNTMKNITRIQKGQIIHLLEDRLNPGEANNVPNGFLNAAQRTIIIDWICGIEEETSLMDGNITQEEIEEIRKSMHSMKNPDLRREMKALADPYLNKAVRDAG